MRKAQLQTIPLRNKNEAQQKNLPQLQKKLNENKKTTDSFRKWQEDRSPRVQSINPEL